MIYKISVIIPFYNSEKHLTDAINSIKNQTMNFKDIEIILVNDCSTDKSVNIAKEYALKYENCKFCDLSLTYDEKSGFPGRPRNLGLKHVTSNYVIFQDTDDSYTVDAFEKLYETITRTGVDFVLANHYINSQRGIIKNTLCNKKQDEIIIKPLKKQKTYDKITSGNFIAAWGKIFDYNFITENSLNFFEDGPTEDADFYFQCLNACGKMCILPNDYVYNYNEYSDSTIHNSSEKLFLTFFNGLKRIHDFLHDNIDFSHEVFLSDYFSSLLLIFVTLDVNNSKRLEFLEMIYEFEKNIDEINIKMPEVAFLNKLILKKHFNLAILVGKVYNQFYNNEFIKKIYRKYIDFKRLG